MGDPWYLDELFLKIQGRQPCLWRAVDEDGDVLDILVQSHRNRRAAIRFFRTLLKGQGCVPRRLITDKLRSYPTAHRTVMPSVGGRASDAPVQVLRSRQRFLSVQGLVLNLFRGGRHLLRAVHHRLRPRSFRVWDEVTSAC